MKLRVAELVAGFKLSVVVELLLDGVIGQVHVTIGHVLDGEFSAACSQVSVGVPVALQVAVDRAHQGEAPDIELSILVQ